jgi:tetratricopeptide (TPR) repeat protein
MESAPARRDGEPVFRGPEQRSRAPRPAGSITSVDGEVATIDLGSLDGLVKGTELPVFRDERFTQPIGRLLVTTVFRERSRGRVLAGREVVLNSRVRVPANAYLGAVMQQVDALSSRGDPDAARAIADKAALWAQTADIQPGQRWRTFERLAQLEFQIGALQAAEQHYQSVVDGLSAGPQASAEEQSVAFNDLAVLRMLRGNFEGVEELLNEAGSKSVATDDTSGRSLNNLGVLAELHGDRRKAETLYVNALRALLDIPDAPSQERAAVEANLARVRSSR